DERLVVKTAPGGQIAGVTIAIHRSRFIDGVVTGARGEPLAEVPVVASRERPRDFGAVTVPGVLRDVSQHVFCRADASGRFHLGPLPHSEIQLSVCQAPYLPWITRLL